MGPDGLAQGELREGEAIDPVRALSKKGMRDRLGLVTGGEPEPYPDQGGVRGRPRDHAGRACAHAAAHGITFIQNMDGNLYTLELLEELHRRGELTARVKVPFHFKNFMDIAMLEKASRRWRTAISSRHAVLRLRQAVRGRRDRFRHRA